MGKKRMVVGMSGASCAALGVMLLQQMQAQPTWETHLVISHAAQKTLAHETNFSAQQVAALATACYDNDDIGAPLASGSFFHEGMVVVPCSMKTTAAIAHGYSENLLLRAADVALKERRRLVLVTREAPLNLIHLQNMLAATQAGAIIYPPVMELYSHPKSIDAIMLGIVRKIMRLFGITTDETFEWSGLR